MRLFLSSSEDEPSSHVPGAYGAACATVSFMPGADQYWSAKQGYAPNWYAFCAGLIARRVSGDGNLPPTLWALRTFCSRPVGVFLEIGCLSGDKLAGLKKEGLIRDALRPGHRSRCH